jgi:uncharacterized protein (TIGR02466 family)
MTTIAKAELRTYFATPLIVADVAEAASLNPPLAAAIRARAASHASVEHSNLGGWQSAWDLADWGGAEAADVLDAARDLATRATSDRAGKPVRVTWKLNAWANLNRGGHANEFHTHPGSFWSGTYYVDDGGIAENQALGGEFEIADPRGPGPAMYAPMLSFAMPGGQSMGASELIRPRAGTLVLFPAWLSHAVRPYKGTRERISVAFNLSL